MHAQTESICQNSFVQYRQEEANIEARIFINCFFQFKSSETTEEKYVLENAFRPMSISRSVLEI